MNLALFDFDGTITANDNFTDFITYLLPKRKLIIGFILLFPIILGYKLGIISSGKTRMIISRFVFRGCNYKTLLEMGKNYSKKIIPKYLNSEISKQLDWHKSRGDLIIVVSASLNVYLEHWCIKNNFKLICTKLEVVNGLCSGKYVDGDCAGKQKVIKIKEQYNINDFTNIYAYGDTKEDLEMLNLAQYKYYKNKML